MIAINTTMNISIEEIIRNENRAYVERREARLAMRRTRRELRSTARRSAASTGLTGRAATQYARSVYAAMLENTRENRVCR